MPGKWCTVSTTGADGRRYSLDVQAASTYDAAHLYLHHVKGNPDWPQPTLGTVFEVVAGGKLYHVDGIALKRWIADRRQELKGPKGLLFRERPTLD